MTGIKRARYFMILIGSLLVGSCASLWGDPSDKAGTKPLPKEWQTRTFRVDPYRPWSPGQLPALPSADASESNWISYLRTSTDVMRKRFEKLGLPLPAGSIVAFDEASSTLVVHSRLDELAALELFADQESRHQPPHLAFQLNIVQAEGSVLREITRQAETQGNLARQWERLEKLAAEGRARLLQTARLESLSGSRASLNSGTLRTKENPNEPLSVLQFEIDPVVSRDNWRVDTDFYLEYHYAPPTNTVSRTSGAGKQGEAETLTTEFHCAKVTSSMTFGSGITRLIGVWKPEGVPELDKQDILHAAFLRVDCVLALPEENPSLAANVEKYGAKAVPPPPNQNHGLVVIPPGMQRRMFTVPVDFLAVMGLPEEPAGPEAPPDPFAGKTAPGNDASRPMLWLPKNTLTQQGIRFPEGAHVFFDGHVGRLTVINTPENLDLMDAFVSSLLWCIHPNGINYTLQVFEADEELLRKIAHDTQSVADHTTALHQLQKLATQGKAVMTSTQRLETRSGQRAKISAGSETVSTSDPTKALFNGTMLELAPVMGPDGYTVDFEAALNQHLTPAPPPSPPTESKEAKANEMQPVIEYSMNAGAHFHTRQQLRTTRLISLWKPGDPFDPKNHRLRAAFLSLNYVKFDEPADPEPESK